MSASDEAFSGGKQPINYFDFEVTEHKRKNWSVFLARPIKSQNTSVYLHTSGQLVNFRLACMFNPPIGIPQTTKRAIAHTRLYCKFLQITTTSKPLGCPTN